MIVPVRRVGGGVICESLYKPFARPKKYEPEYEPESELRETGVCAGPYLFTAARLGAFPLDIPAKFCQLGFVSSSEALLKSSSVHVLHHDMASSSM